MTRGVIRTNWCARPSENGLNMGQVAQMMDLPADGWLNIENRLRACEDDLEVLYQGVLVLMATAPRSKMTRAMVREVMLYRLEILALIDLTEQCGRSERRHKKSRATSQAHFAMGPGNDSYWGVKLRSHGARRARR